MRGQARCSSKFVLFLDKRREVRGSAQLRRIFCNQLPAAPEPQFRIEYEAGNCD
jgi:hypothetical protein